MITEARSVLPSKTASRSMSFAGVPHISDAHSGVLGTPS